jgi:hypothetical protein
MNGPMAERETEYYRTMGYVIRNAPVWPDYRERDIRTLAAIVAAELEAGHPDEPLGVRHQCALDALAVFYVAPGKIVKDTIPHFRTVVLFARERLIGD